MKRLAALLLVAAAAACTKGTAPTMNTTPPGLSAIPAQLAYLCVSPGCMDTQTVEIDVHGDRRVAILRVLLSGGGAADFSIVPSEMAPFIVGAGSSFTVDVTYTPKGAPAPGEAKLLVTYTDASPDDSPDRLQPGQLEVPLVRRIVGEPLLVVAPTTLQFGVVDAGMSKSLPVHVSNQGFGNLVLEIASVDSGTPAFSAMLPASTAMAPDSGFDLPIVFHPATAAYTKALIEVLPTATEVLPGYITVEGTSLGYAKLAMQPAGDLDFGFIVKGHNRTVNRDLVNQGGVPLVITSIAVNDTTGDISVTAPALDGGMLTLDPLQHTPFSMLINGQTAGDVDATITLNSTDPTDPSYVMHVTGTISDPKVLLTPMTVDFGITKPDGGPGKVPVGWVITRPLEIKNIGYGPLTVKNIILVSGSAVQYTLDNVPTLPFMLDRDARTAVNIELRAESVLTFNGSVSVETDDATTPFAEATLMADVGTCLESCPILNGTPTCDSSQNCQVGMCNVGWYDTDGLAATGCECKEIGTDPGAFCMGAANLGTLNDEDGSANSFTGIIPVQGDEDLIKFYGNDQTGFFSDAYDVKVRLTSSDPGIHMCVYHNRGSNPGPGECYFAEEVCPGASNYYEKGGSFGTDDSAAYIVKVFRDPQSAPTCTSYTVFVSNGE